MSKDTIIKHVDAARQKADLLNRSLSRYILLSVLAGIYVGFGIMLIFSIGAPLKAAGAPGLKALMGACFGISLTLVVFAGSELFTGNNMVMLIGNLSKKVHWSSTLKIWCVSFLGNLAGSLLMALALRGTGLIFKEPLRSFILSTASDKMHAPFMELFFRGLLCNILVCLALWTGSRAADDISRLVLIFWCLFGFIGSSFEHCVANMSLLGMSLLIPDSAGAVSWAGFAYNLFPVTLGNLAGGLLLGGSYWFVYGEKSYDRL